MRSLLIRYPASLALYLILVSLIAFALPESIRAPIVIGLIILQFTILFCFGESTIEGLRSLSRIKFLVLFLILIGGFSIDSGAKLFTLPVLGLNFYLAGAVQGSVMALQIALVVLTSFVVRTVGTRDSFLQGLKNLRITPLLAYSLDATLALLENEDQSARRGSGSGGGGGGGGGRNRRREDEADNSPGIIAKIRALDFSALGRAVESNLKRSSERARSLGLGNVQSRDVAIIAALAAVMLGVKMVKVLPGLPIFSGAKAAIFIPLYIVAAYQTKSRWGATVAGTIMGIVAFLNGDGRYGIFEIVKHIAPGVLIDFVAPVSARFRNRLSWFILLGLLAAFARTSTEFLMVVVLSPGSPELYLFPAMRLVPNLFAGFLSGFIAYALMRYLEGRFDTITPRAESEQRVENG